MKAISVLRITPKLNFNDMEVVLLRKMADKSVINFGTHEHLTVRDVLNLGDYTYIAWMYYSINGISFVDSILEEIGITGDMRIEKPGTDQAKMGKWKQSLFDKIESEEERMKLAKHLSKVRKVVQVKAQCRIDNRAKMSAGYLQRANHGHQKLKGY